MTSGHVCACACCVSSLFVGSFTWYPERTHQRQGASLEVSPCPTSSLSVNHLWTLDSGNDISKPCSFLVLPGVTALIVLLSLVTGNGFLLLGSRFTSTSKAEGSHNPPNISGGLIQA